MVTYHLIFTIYMHFACNWRNYQIILLTIFKFNSFCLHPATFTNHSLQRWGVTSIPEMSIITYWLILKSNCEIIKIWISFGEISLVPLLIVRALRTHNPIQLECFNCCARCHVVSRHVLHIANVNEWEPFDSLEIMNASRFRLQIHAHCSCRLLIRYCIITYD